MKSTITITRSIEVNPLDLTSEDIGTLDCIQVRSAVTLLQEMLNESLAHNHTAEVTTPTINAFGAKKPAAQINNEPIDTVTAPRERNVNHTTIGLKIGKTSKYHYVSYDKRPIAKKKWGTQITTSVNSKSKRVFRKQFLTEIEAALAVDKYLDSVNDCNRPRNRDSHLEIMKAYLLADTQEINEKIDTRSISDISTDATDIVEWRVI